ncbi:MAG: uracil-DNA glycosylase [Candidatus Eiseniibacteriota bacterium]
MLLERERARGRRRLVLGELVVTQTEVLVSAAASASTSQPGVLALPGFETPVPQPQTQPPPQPAPQTQPPAQALTITRSLAVRSDLPQDLSALASMVSSCRKCGLCETRTQTVFADGSPKSKLLLVGEAPGRDEDAQGLPFVGRAGQLLNKMLTAIDLKREEVYICNVLKCRPPDNRTPLPEEVERCLPYLEQQIALIRPTLICALGLSAMQALLGTKASMTSMRGRTFEFRGVPLVPTYHPAALLRNPGLKRDAWTDLQRVRDMLHAGAAA